MISFSLCERIFRKIKKIFEPALVSIRRRKLNNTDFTIISNNCWGGICYEYFGLPKQSPTVGCYLFADDYIKLISNLKLYMSKELVMISYQESIYREKLKLRNQLKVPIGRLGDIEIIFLHYKDSNVAKEKWDRRVQRINYNNLIYKFSYMNSCTDEHVEQFKKIKNIKKVLFVPKKTNSNEEIVVPYTDEEGQIYNDTFYWNKHIDVVSLINRPITGLKH